MYIGGSGQEKNFGHGGGVNRGAMVFWGEEGGQNLTSWARRLWGVHPGSPRGIGKNLKKAEK